MADSLSPYPAGAKSPTTVPPFDQVAVAVAPGDDLVVRMPGVLLVVAVNPVDAPPPASPKLGGWGAAPSPPPAQVQSGDVRVGALVDLCRRVSAGGSRAPGRRLHEELRAWLPTMSDLPSFAVAAATEEGLAVVLVGKGTAEVPDLGLRLSSADGDQRLPDGQPFLDRLVDWPPAALRLSAGSPITTAPHPLADLESGSVPGAAAVLSPAAATAPAPPPEGPPPTMLVRLPAPGSLTPQAAATPPAAAGIRPLPPSPRTAPV